MINLLRLAKENEARVVQASTSEIYGDPNMHPQNENYWGNINPIGVRFCYDEGKRAAETLYHDSKRQHNVDVRVNRIFNTYDPQMSPDDGRVGGNFIVQAIQNKPITIYGKGTQTRSFCYVSDLVGVVYKTLQLKAPIDLPINIGNPKEFTILELAQMVFEITKSNSKIVFKTVPLDDPKQRKPDIFRANKVLNWQPIIDINLGIEKTTDYFKKVIQ